ncbi:flagellar hook-length control protein FliK [Azospirillum doebereinerae]|uniref:Flagellar hook-length control protein FliK n=1 Tax=Azospirillum doebereinerae TaxID=92933 RepID=A0A3S0V4K6_9PROT|nr:flagellar hook-length control protein FliK [Azospirillum doebereinerae]RUQ66591.1 flagellar hook-length control protein FliK [Azospirillum doebereinerae]
MTAMPDLVKAPPRPAAPSSATGGGASAKDPQEGGFADLLDEAANETANEGTSGPGASKPRPKTPKPDAANGAVPDTGEPAIPWLAAPIQAVAPPAPGGEAALAPTVPGAATDAAGLTPESLGGALPQAGTETTSPLPGGATPGAGKIEQAAPGTATASAAPQASNLVGAPADPLAAQAPPTDMPGGAPPATVPSGPVPATAPPNGASTLAPPATEAAEAVVNPTGEPRRAGRNGGPGAKDAGRQVQDGGKDGGKADPTAAIARAIAEQAANSSRTAAINGDPVPGLAPASSGGSSGTPAPGGFDTLLALPGQAATHYAAAASSGRAAATHAPAMAQLSAPLVRVAEAGGGEFHIDLAPAELGRIHVVADVSDGHVTLAVQAENADTLALLRRDLQQLEKALGDAGLKLDNATLNFSLQGDGQSRGFAAPDQGGGGSRNAWRGAAGLTVADAPIDHAPRPIDGLVDVTI